MFFVELRLFEYRSQHQSVHRARKAITMRTWNLTHNPAIDVLQRWQGNGAFDVDHHDGPPEIVHAFGQFAEGLLSVLRATSTLGAGSPLIRLVEDATQHRFPLPDGPTGAKRRIVFTNPTLRERVNLRNQCLFGRNSGFRMLAASLLVDPAHYIHNQLCIAIPSRLQGIDAHGFSVVEFRQGGTCIAHEFTPSFVPGGPLESAFGTSPERSAWKWTHVIGEKPDDIVGYGTAHELRKNLERLDEYLGALADYMNSDDRR